MIEVDDVIIIDRPAAEVFGFVADQTNAPVWQKGLHEVRRLTEGPLRVGTEHEFVRRFAGRRVAERNRFVAFEPGRFVAFELAEGWITGRASYLAEPLVDGRTRLTCRMHFRAHGAAGVFEPMLGRLLAADSRRDSVTLREILEQSAPGADGADKRPRRSINRRLTRTGNRIAVWMYGRFDGRLSGGPHAQVLMITTPGRTSGVPRSTCVRYLELPEGLVVWGTGSGSATDPDWFRNLRAAEVAEVQVGSEHRRVRARELKGSERDAMWEAVILRRAPGVARYARKAGRPIPVALLQTGTDATGPARPVLGERQGTVDAEPQPGDQSWSPQVRSPEDVSTPPRRVPDRVLDGGSTTAGEPE